MHDTAMRNGEAFFRAYAPTFPEGASVVDIGAQDVNGSLKSACPAGFRYTGLDFIEGKGVDIVLTDPYKLPLDNESVDIAVSSSCFEHSEMFWLTYLETMRVLKPHGLFYLNVPSAGSFHRYPVDCWRFYPDSGSALVKWGERSGFRNVLLESFIETSGKWGDFVGVFLKDAQFAGRYPERILRSQPDFANGKNHPSHELLNHRRRMTPGGQRRPRILKRLLSQLSPTTIRSRHRSE